ncbi:MAG: AbrB/MazE/SpoVT family DNA-binding domain-containing protein [Oxalobacter formigenes]|nr:AbrB/MazE/SpoVT family DNA-binding domain-containing protein [Oxalobacter formigenes]
MDTQVLTVSSKGKILLPAEMRRKMAISTGDKLVAYANGDTIMLKTLKLPSVEECKAAWDEAQQWAASVGYKEGDVNTIVKEYRKKKREQA